MKIIVHNFKRLIGLSLLIITPIESMQNKSSPVLQLRVESAIQRDEFINEVIPEKLHMAPIEKDITKRAYECYSDYHRNILREEIEKAVMTMQGFDKNYQMYTIHYFPCDIVKVFFYIKNRSSDLLTAIVYNKVDKWIAAKKAKDALKNNKGYARDLYKPTHIQIAKNTWGRVAVYNQQQGIWCITNIYQKEEALKILNEMHP